MRNVTKMPATVLLTIVTLVVPLAFAQNSDSVAAAARQKTTEKKAKRVITDDDMPQRPSPEKAATPVPTATGNAASAEAAATTESVNAKSDKMAELQQKLEQAQKDRVILEKKLQALEEKALKTEDENHRRMYREAIENQQTTLVEFERVRQELERQIAGEQGKKKDKESQPR